MQAVSRTHTGPKAAQACESIDARAFTVGNHVAFNAGEYDPSSAEGQHVLAHELAHVRQQTQGAVSMLPQEDAELEIDPDPALEREAEETAQRVMKGGELGIQRLGDAEVHVQRMGGPYAGLPDADAGTDHQIPASQDATAKYASSASLEEGESAEPESIEEVIDRVAAAHDMSPAAQAELKAELAEGSDFDLEELQREVGIASLSELLGKIVPYWELLSVPFSALLYIVRNTEGSLTERLEQIRTALSEQTGEGESSGDAKSRR